MRCALQDYGPSDVFASMQDECFEKVIDKYTYKVCVGGKAVQKEGTGETNLGTFSGFADDFTVIEFTDVRLRGLSVR